MKRLLTTRRTHSGFTIVELLIVIVVIGILAAITIVAFNGIRQRAVIATLQSDLRNGVSQLKSTQATTGSYPGDTSGVKSSGGTSYQYTVDNVVNPQVFCLTATNNGTSYYVDQNGTPQPGTCPGQNITWAIASALPTGYWNQTLMSGDGTKLIASDSGGMPGAVFVRSTDGGATWTNGNRPTTNGIRAPGLITTDGSKLLASLFINGGTNVYVSTNLGTSWTLSNAGGQIVYFAGSSTGSVLYAAEYYDSDSQGGGLKKSTDGGVTWAYLTSLPDANTTINAVATSADGLKVVAAPNGPTTLKYSSNGGTSWTALASSGARNWTDIAVSSDGTKMAAIGNGTVYTSGDSGATWTARPGPGTRTSLAMSSDGSKLISINTTNAQYVYTSNDSGVSWTPVSSIGTGFWLRPSISADGMKYVATNVASANGVVYIGTYH